MEPSIHVKQALLPGQKHPTPTRGFGDRVFYESLLRQRPDSIMAQEWCVYHGVLDKDEAQKLYNLILQRRGGKMTSTSQSNDMKFSPLKETKVKKVKKRIISEDVEFDAEMDVGGSQGIGTSTL